MVKKLLFISTLAVFVLTNTCLAAKDGMPWMFLLLSSEDDGTVAPPPPPPPPPGVSTVVSAGQTWMDRNLGASRVATSMTDAKAHGDLYQWGRGTDGHEKRNSGTTSTLSSSDAPGHSKFILSTSSPYDWRSPQNDNLWQGVSGINNPCPSGFRLPTLSEWETELASWTSDNGYGAWGSPLKISLAGYRTYGSGTIEGATHPVGMYWSATVDGPKSGRLYIDELQAGISKTYGFQRALGHSVRCIQDDGTVAPPPTPPPLPPWVKTVVSAGQTWMDRNLGASRVATSIKDTEAYGDFYQWGRGTDGHEKRNSGTTTTLSNSDTPGHDKFILSPEQSVRDWRSSQNDDLWQGFFGINNPCPSGLRLPTITEWETESASWASNDRVGAWGSPLKLVPAGRRHYRWDKFYSVDWVGYYWSSSVAAHYISSFVFSDIRIEKQPRERGMGLSVRCIQD